MDKTSTTGKAKQTKGGKKSAGYKNGGMKHKPMATGFKGRKTVVKAGSNSGPVTEGPKTKSPQAKTPKQDINNCSYGKAHYSRQKKMGL